jgi:hypothetical protein
MTCFLQSGRNGKYCETHFAEVRAAFAAVRPEQRILLFCHDPTALPFLARDEVISAKIPQIERTVIGHLHSNLYLRLSRILSGMPAIKCFGHSIHRMSTALSEARYWRRFNVLLCPSLAGIELLKDGGYFTVDLDQPPPDPRNSIFTRSSDRSAAHRPGPRKKSRRERIRGGPTQPKLPGSLPTTATKRHPRPRPKRICSSQRANRN